MQHENLEAGQLAEHPGAHEQILAEVQLGQLGEEGEVEDVFEVSELAVREVELYDLLINTPPADSGREGATAECPRSASP